MIAKTSAAPAGLRERKKLAARAAILDAASSLFVERGFEATRIEQIAARADIGVGSVYNHFETKADILVAILLADVADVIAQTQAVVLRGEPSAAAVLRETVGVLFDVIVRRPRDLWRTLIGHALLDAGTLGAAYLRVEGQLRDVVRIGLERLRENGNVGRVIAAKVAVDLTFALAKTVVYAFVFEPAADGARLLDTLERQMNAVFPRP